MLIVFFGEPLQIFSELIFLPVNNSGGLEYKLNDQLMKQNTWQRSAGAVLEQIIVCLMGG